MLRRFGAAPRDPSSGAEYVAGCQTPRGGFGRVPGAVPRLDDTLRALEILGMLSEMRPQEPPEGVISRGYPP